MPGGCRARTGQTAGRVADDRGGPPEPFLEEMIGKVFQSGLHAPIVFAGDEHEAVGVADLRCQFFQRRGRLALRMLLVHAIQHRQPDCLGVDQFDCVMQTRIGRHGTALTSTGKLHIKNAKHALSDEPLDVECSCEVCQRHSRGYIRHLFQVGEPTASRLVSLHNIAWTLDLMARMRDAIASGTFASLRADVLAVWG